MSDSKKVYIFLFGLFLIIIGLFIMFNSKIEQYMSSKDNDAEIEKYAQKHQSKAEEKDKKPSFEGVSLPKDKSKMVGYIEIPDVDIKESVYKGAATLEQLERGVSFVEDDEKLTDQNISIAGHTNMDYDNYQFTSLHRAKIGSKVKFTVEDVTKEYEIKSIRNVEPTEVSVLDEQEDKPNQLTLITCDNYDEETGEWLDRTIYVAEEI